MALNKTGGGQAGCRGRGEVAGRRSASLGPRLLLACGRLFYSLLRFRVSLRARIRDGT